MLKNLCVALVLAVASAGLSQTVSGKATVAGVGGANDATRPTHAQIAALYNACLVHGWPMNDAAGSIFHDVFGTDNMAISGTVAWQKNGTLPGLTPYFNGAGYAVGSESTDTNFDGSSAFTVAFWTVGSSSAGYATQQWLVGNWQFNATGSNPGWGVFQNANAADGGANPVDANAGIFNLFNNQVCCSGFGAIQVNPTTTSIVAPTTHFYAASYDGSRANAGVTIVFDGTTYSTANSNLTTIINDLTGSIASGLPIQVGQAPGSSPIPYTGAIAYLAVYNCGINASTLLSWGAQSPRIN